jgi:hypothetical protein
MLLTDLFGGPTVHVEQSAASRRAHAAPKMTEEQRRLAAFKAARTKKLKDIEASPQLSICDEVIEHLRRPILSFADIPSEYLRMKGCFRSDKSEVPLLEETGDEIDPDVVLTLPYEAWGPEWVQDGNGLKWSKEGVTFLQNQVFWESLEELRLHNNEPEKWSVLKWIFQPAVVKQYIYDVRIGRSHCLATHERDHPFSFHNCAMAARMEPDAVRAGVRRNVAVELYQAVIRVVTY